jgi:hypothetical protein
MPRGLYDIVKEYHTATPERRKELEAERAESYPEVKGWPQYPEMIYCEVAQNVNGWNLMRADIPYMDNYGRWVGRR